ncbi:Protein of unknown function [Virgibacillus subterraneus]|uniref:DUF1878 family protein n=1 Tax=Virgibacillus subterraneus TaxID=621109 RepID=A0A1H9FTL3_9BACI|nr:DUF1878 family protein [Virgibacillus subterraneus]SEQ41244.1 Protein of unknown function [Virgibacillus subterraneus]
MENIDQNKTTAFHLCLLAKVINIDQFPLIKLLIEKDISQMEFEELMKRLKMLDSQFEEQKEEGFLDFSGLLVHFAGMLSEKLYPNETIYALKKEGYYPSLMNEFIRVLEENEK